MMKIDRIVLAIGAVALFIFLAVSGLTGCKVKIEKEPPCNPRTSQVIFRAKCYQYGQIIYDSEVVCPEKWHLTSIEYRYAYDKQSGSMIYFGTDGIKCFVLKQGR